MSGAVFDEVSSLLLSDALNVGHFVPELDAVELVRVLQQLRPKSCGDELRGGG